MSRPCDGSPRELRLRGVTWLFVTVSAISFLAARGDERPPLVMKPFTVFAEMCELKPILDKKDPAGRVVGVLVASVLEKSPAEKAGLKKGMVITHIQGMAVSGKTEKELHASTSSLMPTPDNSLVINVRKKFSSRKVPSSSLKKTLSEPHYVYVWDETQARRLIGTTKVVSGFDSQNGEYFEVDFSDVEFSLEKGQKVKIRITFSPEFGQKLYTSFFSEVRVRLSLTAVGKVAIVDEVVKVEIMTIRS